MALLISVCLPAVKVVPIGLGFRFVPDSKFYITEEYRIQTMVIRSRMSQVQYRSDSSAIFLNLYKPPYLISIVLISCV
jgi:hypothetical protein